MKTSSYLQPGDKSPYTLQCGQRHCSLKIYTLDVVFSHRTVGKGLQPLVEIVEEPL